MKKTYFIFGVLLLLILNSCSNTELDETVNSDNYFKLYGSFNNEFVNSVEQYGDDGLLIAGYSQDDSEETWAYVSKTSYTGMLDWDTILVGNKNSSAYDVYNLEDQNQIYVACGQTYSQDSTWLYLIDYSTDGIYVDSVSTKILASEINSVQLLYQDNGTLRVLSQVTRVDPVSDKELGFVLIHDLENGVLEESFTIELHQQLAGKVSVQYNSAQSVYIAASVYETEKTDDNTPSTDIRVISISDNAIEWDNNYGQEGVSESCSDFLINNNSLVVAGNYKSNTAANQQMYLLTMDMLGNETGNNIVSVDGVEADISCSAFTLNASNNYVFCGEVNTGTGTQDILFLETANDGSNITYETYGSQGVVAGVNLAKSINYIDTDNAYLLTGVMETINNFDICIFKLDLNGQWIVK